jgi:hypothetical protein
MKDSTDQTLKNVMNQKGKDSTHENSVSSCSRTALNEAASMSALINSLLPLESIMSSATGCACSAEAANNSSSKDQVKHVNMMQSTALLESAPR